MTSFLPFGSLIDRIRNKDDDDFVGTYGYSDVETMGENNVREGMHLIIMTVVFLFLLVVLRFCCIWFIDVVILCEHRRNRHQGSLFRRILSTCCPRWFPPVVPSGGDTENEFDPEGQPSSDDNNSSSQHETELVERNSNGNYAKRLLQTLTVDQRRRLFASILDHRFVTQADFLERPDGCGCGPPAEKTTGTVTPIESSSLAVFNGSAGVAATTPTTSPPPPPPPTTTTTAEPNANSNSNADWAICCPICIQDIKVGDKVYHCKTCHKLFRYDCMIEWIVTGSTLCPYCRREMFTRAMLEEAYHKQQQKPKEAP